jgi:hypothetical protein
LVEHSLGKGEVTSSILVIGSRKIKVARATSLRAELTVGFEQAVIKVEKVEEFGQLQRAVEEAFSPEKVNRFLKSLHRGKIRIRDFDAILVTKTLEAVTGRADLGARRLYGSLTLSDQGQMREFYLSKLEAVDIALRHKFKKLYQYY